VPRCRRGNDPDSASHDGTGRRNLSAAGATFMVPIRSELVLHIIIGARQVNSRITMKQARPVASRHLQKVLECITVDVRIRSRARHGPEQARVALLHDLRRLLARVGKNYSCALDPGVGPLQFRPLGGGLGKRLANKAM